MLTVVELSTQHPSCEQGGTSSASYDDLKLPIGAAPVWPKAAFVSDVSIPDETQVALGSTFTKTWLVKNTGQQDWPEDTTLRLSLRDNRGEELPLFLSHVEGDQLIVLHDDIPVQCPAGRCVEITVKLQVPLTAATTGRSILSYFSLHGGDFWSFGDQLHVDVVVVNQ